MPFAQGARADFLDIFKIFLEGGDVWQNAPNRLERGGAARLGTLVQMQGKSPAEIGGASCLSTQTALRGSAIGAGRWGVCK